MANPPMGELMTPLARVKLMVEPSGNRGSLESFTSAVATAVLPVVTTIVMCSLSCPPGMVGDPLSSSHGVGGGVAELHSTPIR